MINGLANWPWMAYSRVGTALLRGNLRCARETESGCGAIRVGCFGQHSRSGDDFGRSVSGLEAEHSGDLLGSGFRFYVPRVGGLERYDSVFADQVGFEAFWVAMSADRGE